MAEYIEREAVINQFESNGGYFTYGKTTVKAIVSRIKMQPAADVEPVRRGHWIKESEHILLVDGTYKEWDNFYCSECDAPENAPRKFCAECGAKMGGE